MLCSTQIIFAQEKSAGIGIVNGKATNLPKPAYPQHAKDFCAAGQVKVEVLISEDGGVISAEAISGDELLYESSVEAAKKAKFTPNQARAKVRGIIVYNFVPEKKCILLGVVNKKARFLPKPIYPKSCRCRGIIKVKIMIDINGNVIAASTASGHPLLRSAAANAARKTKFSPLIDVPPIFVVAFLEYRFYADGIVLT